MEQEKQKLITALKEIVNEDAIFPWFNTPNDTFSGRTPDKVLLDGDSILLWEMVWKLTNA